ncbi:hypothetical protein [Bremerella cremea]|uniref:hypothetical protein n=1 Tax=Bremerella cremea TaxID=1031537 RepID=UPI0031F09287
MIDSRSSSTTAPQDTVKQAVQLGFYIGSGLGLATGSAIATLLGSNLLWQTGGLVAGAFMGICCGAGIVWLQRRLKPVTAPVYRPTSG